MFNISTVDKKSLIKIIQSERATPSEQLKMEASALCEQTYHKHVYMRGLIEFTNYCKNDCYYCGIRASNTHIHRYRLTKEEIITCCDQGYQLGFRTFVLQGGEDPYFTDDLMCQIISSISNKYPDCAITLSIGERSYQSYQRLFNAGATRYLLRHETATTAHYQQLHPESMSLDVRKECLFNLKDIGFQVGAGFMVGSPFQTDEHLAEDLLFLKELQPHMVGIGPFIPHQDTPFKNYAAGTLADTISMLALTRLMLPTALLPATTALGSIDPKGREQGLLSGANVVMPNLSPLSVRQDYSLYDNKICTGDEAAECRCCIERRVNSIGFDLLISRGDHPEQCQII